MNSPDSQSATKRDTSVSTPTHSDTWSSSLLLGQQISLALALGASALPTFVLLPLIQNDTGLIDQNLAASLIRPLQLRSAEITLLCSLLFAGTIWKLRNNSLLKNLALLIATLAAVDRFILLPRMHAALRGVDLALQRPLAIFEEMALFQSLHHYLNAMFVLLAVTAMFFTTKHLQNSSAHTKNQPKN